MKKNLLVFGLFLTCLTATSQVGHGGEPAVWSDKHLASDIPFIATPQIDLNLLAAEDAVTDQYKEAPYRFGVENAVNYSTSNSGIWRIDAQNNTAVWQLGIECPQALTVSIRFAEFKMPKGGEVFIWSAERDEFIGSFDHKSNGNGGSFATGLIHSDRVVVELTLPLSKMGEQLLSIDQIVHGYRSFLKTHFEEQEEADRGPFGDSGGCEVNVNCPEGDDWQVEKRSVAIIVEGGFGLCTGALVNNTANDGTPYFLTANHCTEGSNVGNWTFYFNHEAATCSGTAAPTNYSISGSTLKANNAYSDFALLLLDETPPSNFDVEYAGWDATDSEAAVQSAVCIHHPSGDIKKISFEEDAPYHDVGNGAQVWWIDDWELGVTEPGSSGSPLFNQDHRIIGQLFGGASACIGNNGNGQFDFYGRFGQSWDHSSSNSAQLMHWLDPNDTGVLTLNGYPTGFQSAQLDASVSTIGGIPANSCGNVFYPNFIIQNNGSDDLNSCTIHWQLNNGPEQTQPFNGPLSQGESALVWIPEINAANGNNTLEIWITDINGVDDENEGNNTVSISFNVVAGDVYQTTLQLVFDEYPEETFWTLEQNGNEISSGGPYADNAGGDEVELNFCLAPGCYTLTIFDDYGDGMCCGYGDGSYTLFNQNQVSVATGGEFADSEAIEFCVDANAVSEGSELTFEVFPNPATNLVTITNTRFADYVEIRDVSGRLLKKVNCQDALMVISTDGLADGTYFVSVFAKDKQNVTRITVQH